MDKQVDFNVGKAYELVTGKLEAWIKTAIEMLPNFILAVIVVVAFVLIGKLSKKLFEKLFRRITDNKSLQSLLSSIIYLAIVAVGTFIALSVLKLDGAVTSLLAGAGVIGLALGFAFQEIASNFIAGTMMSIRKPFRVDDLIETNDFFGIIRRIHLRTTEMITFQGQIVQIPNSMVFKNPIINYTQLGKRRIDLEVGVTYGEDLPKAKKVAKEAVEGLEGLTDDGVTIFYTGFGGSSINFVIRFWIPFTRKHFEYLSKRDEGVIAIKQSFDKNNITIPFPIRTLDFGDVDFKSIFSTYSNQVATTPGNAGQQSSDNSNG